MLTTGNYDIVFDVNQNGDVDDSIDVVDSVSPGFTVIPPPVAKSSDSGGTEQNVYYQGETIYVSGSGFIANDWVDVYVVDDDDWTLGGSIGTDVTGTVETLQADGSGNLGPAAIWPPVLTTGNYDIVFDFNRNGDVDDGIDVVDSASPGFIVYRMPIGGEVYPVNKMAVLMPWLSLTLVILLGTIGQPMTLRRRLAQRVSR